MVGSIVVRNPGLSRSPDREIVFNATRGDWNGTGGDCGGRGRGISVGSPRFARMRRTTAASTISAISRNRQPQLDQKSVSIQTLLCRVQPAMAR